MKKIFKVYKYFVLFVTVSVLGSYSSAEGLNKKIVNMPSEIRMKLFSESALEENCADVENGFSKFISKKCTIETGVDVECDFTIEELKRNSVLYAKYNDGSVGAFFKTLSVEKSVFLPFQHYVKKGFDREILTSILLESLPVSFEIKSNNSLVLVDLIKKISAGNGSEFRVNHRDQFEFKIRNKLLYCGLLSGSLFLESREKVSLVTMPTVGFDHDKIVNKVIDHIEELKQLPDDDFGKFFSLGMFIAQSFEGTSLFKETFESRLSIGKSLESMLINHESNKLNTHYSDSNSAKSYFQNNKRQQNEKIIFSIR